MVGGEGDAEYIPQDFLSRIAYLNLLLMFRWQLHSELNRNVMSYMYEVNG